MRRQARREVEQWIIREEGGYLQYRHAGTREWINLGIRVPPTPEDMQAMTVAMVEAYMVAHPAPKGDTGPAGRAPTASEIASAVSAWLTANPPAKGDTGARGPIGPSSKVSLGGITLAETATLAIAAGDRTLNFTVTGLATGEDVLLFPASPLPAGYVLKSAVATAANTLRVTLQVPLIALGASYSIPCRVVVLR